jgi:hypothetical protein
LMRSTGSKWLRQGVELVEKVFSLLFLSNKSNKKLTYNKFKVFNYLNNI